MKRKLIGIFLVTLMLCAFLSGCDSLKSAIDVLDGISDEEFLANNPSEEDRTNLVIVLGKVQNAWLDLESLAYLDSDFSESIRNSLEYGIRDGKYYARAHVTVILADGTPTVATLKDERGQKVDMLISGNSAEYVLQKAQTLHTDIVEALMSKSLVGDNPGADLVSALISAGGILQQSDERNKELIILANGLCTTGPLNMLEIDIQKKLPEETMLLLNDGAFADLEGVHVTFNCLGNFCDAQPIITDTIFQKQLSGVWEAYLRKCNVANDVHIPYTGNSYSQNGTDYRAEDYPYDVPVVLFSYSSGGFDIASAQDEFNWNWDSVLICNDQTVGGFSGDECVPNMPENARKLAANMKIYLDKALDAYPDCRIYVIGSISTTNDGSQHATHLKSLGRAQTIAQYLADAGVPEERIVVIDAGTTPLPWRNGDEENEKAKNRVVAVIPSYREVIVNHLREVLEDRFPG